MVSKNIKKVVTFKTSDKEQFRTKSAAANHVKRVNIAASKKKSK
jgi:hypothetical protein